MSSLFNIELGSSKIPRAISPFICILIEFELALVFGITIWVDFGQATIFKNSLKAIERSSDFNSQGLGLVWILDDQGPDHIAFNNRKRRI